MIQMILYSITIMYTPGPVTMTATQIGLQKRMKEGIPFYFGIGFAVFALYILLGYFGSLLLKDENILVISIIGSFYMFYFGIKIFTSVPDFSVKEVNKNEQKMIGFVEGFLLQFFNPKALLAVLPVITIYFPLYHISGIKILGMACFFMVLVMGAPAMYATAAELLCESFFKRTRMVWINRVMGIILLYMSFSNFYQHVWQVL